MSKQYPKWIVGAGLAILAGAAVIACAPAPGGGDDSSQGGDSTGDGGSDSSSGGKGSGGKGSGGKGSGGKDSGTGGSDSSTGGADGTGGGSTASAGIDDLIETICQHEFDCCAEGELTFRLGSSNASTSVEECVSFFKFQAHDSNSTDNPFVSGAGTGLLGILGYQVDLSRVTENAKGIGECVDLWKTMECPKKFTGELPTFCSATVLPGDDVCSLNSLFTPKLTEGDRCTLSLAEGGNNDVECEAGTTCVDAGQPGNESGDFPVCITKSEATQPCTKDTDCDYNLYCSPSGKCTAKGDVGDDCTFKDPDVPMPGDEDASCSAGLKCHPKTLKCVANCTEDYPCSVNVECPEDFVCAPTTVGSDSTTWKTCQPTGTSASDRCDEDADCAANRYCDGSVCQPDNNETEDCSKDSMCAAGMYCDAYYGTCAKLIQAGDYCDLYYGSTNGGCAPDAPFCLQDVVGKGYTCEAELRAEDDFCDPAAVGFEPAAQAGDCGVGLRCETTDLAATWPYACTAGAGEGDDCDLDYADDADLNCGPGLTCKDGACLAQVGPGEECANLDDASYPDASLCSNGACVENWDENAVGVKFICSDAAVPESNGGSGLTCGG